MTGYVRKDTTNNIADGNVINAADLDAEFDGVQDAFNASTGHKHDGTAGEGATINALGPTQDVTISSTLLAPKTTNTVDIGSSSLKFKDLFLAGNASVGGTLAVTGVATLTAQPILSSLTASRAVFTDGSKGLVSNAITGTGNVVMSASPTLTGTAGFENITASGTLGVTGVATLGAGAILNTPASVTLTNATGLPISTGVSGLGTGVATALAVNVGSAGAPVVNGGALGTPSSGTVTNLTGTASININGTVGATTPTTGAFTTVAASSNVTLSGGTANGVTYLNGSKVLTSGSALTFDGTGLSVGTTAHPYKFMVSDGGATGFEVGPGTTYVAGRVLLQSYNRSGSAYTAFDYSASEHKFQISGSDSMVLTSTGLGIGTSSPAAKLHVSGQSRVADSSNAANYILIGSGANAPRGGNSVMAQTGSMVMGTEAASNLSFITNAAEAARLDSAGNLGLGVTPSAATVRTFEGPSAFIIANAGDNGMNILSNSFYDGSFRYKSSSFATRYSQLSGVHSWYTAASGTAGDAISFTQAMTLDASGRLLVGTTSGSGATMFTVNQPTSSTDAKTIVSVATGTNAAYTAFVNTTVTTVGTENSSGGSLVSGSSAYSTVIANNGAYPISFGTNNTERARIDSSGNLLVGTTTQQNSGLVTCKQTTNANSVFSAWNATTAGDAQFIWFGTEAGGTTRGSITYNRSGGLTAYNTTSDYRAKDILGTITDSGSVIDSVPVYMGKMKGATQERPMFIAHETPEYAHTGEKDAVDADGNPVYQQMDASALIPVMWAEIKSLRARVAQLESN